MNKIIYKNIDIEPINTEVSIVNFENEEVIRVVKNQKLDIFDENTFVKLINLKLKNGEIKLKMLSRLLPDAPDFARGFIGIAFRINEKNSEFESYYVRPTNGRHPDPIRRSHGSQYFSYPGYTFSYFREFNIKGFEAPVDIDLNEWIELKAIIKDSKAEFYVNDFSKPALVIENLIHKDNEEGNIGLFVDTGTEAFFKDIEIKEY